MEQENDHISSLEDIRDTLQQSVNVRARKIRKVAKAGTAQKGVFRGTGLPSGSLGIGEHLEQQQPNDGEQATENARAGTHDDTARVQPAVSSRSNEFLPGFRVVFPRSRRNGAPPAAIREKPRGCPGRRRLHEERLRNRTTSGHPVGLRQRRYAEQPDGLGLRQGGIERSPKLYRHHGRIPGPQRW